MTQNKHLVEDLRVRRTRKSLQNAFIELTIQKNFGSVTVAEITERAMVNRATFYPISKTNMIYLKNIWMLFTNCLTCPKQPHQKRQTHRQLG